MLKMDEKLFWSAYKESMESDDVELMKAVPDKLGKWLHKNITHEDFYKFILKYPFVGDVQLCANYFYGPERIMAATEEYRLIRKSYIVVGTSSNGDFIAIPHDGWGSIGYISHDEFGYDQSDLLKYCPVSKSLGEFYFDTWHVKDYPVDYYEAIKYMQNRKL